MNSLFLSFDKERKSLGKKKGVSFAKKEKNPKKKGLLLDYAGTEANSGHSTATMPIRPIALCIEKQTSQN